MIVDTSALFAALIGEEGHEKLLQALTEESGLLPAPALVEYQRVASRSQWTTDYKAAVFVDDLLRRRLRVLDFRAEHARVAAAANRIYGAVTSATGKLNLLDLMVYACAVVERRPILCTGNDYASTDARIHPSSRRDEPLPPADG